MPPLVQHFFEKTGEVSVLRERLIDLEYQHREARTKRTFQADQDQPLQTTDEEFEEAYQREYAEAEGILEAALDKVELARRMCLAEEIDPELYRKPPSVQTDPDSPSVSDVPAEPNTPSPEPADVVEDVQTRERLSLFETAAPGMPTTVSHIDPSITAWVQRQKVDPQPLDERVEHWMQSVTNDVERSRSLSEPRRRVLRAELTGNGVIGLSHSSSHLQNGSEVKLHQESTVIRHSNNKNDEPLLLRKRLSESSMFNLPPPQGSLHDIADRLRRSQSEQEPHHSTM